MSYIDGLVQDCSNSIANALELLQSCTNPSIYRWMLNLSHKMSKVCGALFWSSWSSWKIFIHVIQSCFSDTVVIPFLSRWWRHQIKSFSALLVLCMGNSPVTGEFPSQRPLTRSFDVFFDLRLSKWLCKQWRRWWQDAITLIMTSL